MRASKRKNFLILTKIFLFFTDTSLPLHIITSSSSSLKAAGSQSSSAESSTPMSDPEQNTVETYDIILKVGLRIFFSRTLPPLIDSADRLLFGFPCGWTTFPHPKHPTLNNWGIKPTRWRRRIRRKYPRLFLVFFLLTSTHVFFPYINIHRISQPWVTLTRIPSLQTQLD